MKEIGTVTRIEQDRVVVECKPSAACHACKGELCSMKGRSIMVRNPQQLPLATGETVEIFVPPAQTLTALLKVFGVPALLFVLFYLFAGFFVSQPSEGTRVVSGVVGLSLGFGGMYLWGKKTSEMPVILRKVSVEEEREEENHQENGRVEKA